MKSDLPHRELSYLFHLEGCWQVSTWKHSHSSNDSLLKNRTMKDVDMSITGLQAYLLEPNIGMLCVHMRLQSMTKPTGRYHRLSVKEKVHSRVQGLSGRIYWTSKVELKTNLNLIRLLRQGPFQLLVKRL